MSKDRSELKNLANAKLDKVNQLAGLWENYAQRANVMPWGEVRKRRKVARNKK